MSRNRSVTTTAYNNAERNKAAGVLGGAGGGIGGGIGQLQSGAKARRRYAMFRGWTYAAINAIAQEAAGQPVNVARLLGAEANPEERSSPTRIKSHQRMRMTSAARAKAVQNEMELIVDHPLLDSLENPNPIQHRWQFTYTFVANLNLTGIAFIIAGEGEDGRIEFYSLPTTWIVPIHRDGPYSAIKIVDPKNPTAAADAAEIGRENFGVSIMPNPSDPMAALAPAATQSSAIQIDDHIQSSQRVFFENGVFPSVVVTVGQNPMGPSGTKTRPRLDGTQRRQIYGAIRKSMSGVANYGKPAIVDGLIEKITRLSATQNEMGWEKSEQAVRTRILSSFGVHPYILGEAVNVGGYAQAAKIEERFCKRVNTHLDMLSTAMTTLAGPMVDQSERTLVWWEECSPSDPSLKSNNMQAGRKNGDISKNEYRAYLGLPPDETAGPDSRNKLLDSVGGINGTISILKEIAAGAVQPESATALLSLFLEIPEDQAAAIIGSSGATPVAEIVSALSAISKNMKEPVRVSLDESETPGVLAESVLASARSAGLSQRNAVDTAGLKHQMGNLTAKLAQETAARQADIENVTESVGTASSGIKDATTTATEKLLAAIATKNAGEDQTQMVKDVLGGLTGTIKESLDGIPGPSSGG